MIRTAALHLAVAIGLLTASTLAVAAPGQDSHLLRLAEQRVLETIRDRPVLMVGLPRVAKIAASQLLDADRVQVDAFQVGSQDQILVPGSEERFVYTVSLDTVRSLGAIGAAPVPPINPGETLAIATKDALARFSRVNPGTGDQVADGCGPKVKSTKVNRQTGEITVVCETFGGFAGMWMGDAVSYLYNAQAGFISATNL